MNVMASFTGPTTASLTPEERINLTALQRRDPYISRVIETASQVALYDYDTTSDAWTNTEVEGSLFLYERIVAPFHGFTISNRKQPHNHWEALNEHVEFQNPEDDHFLLYKNRDKIFGIWFFDEIECRKIGDLARQLVLETTSKTDAANQSETAAGKHGIMKDILSSSSTAASAGGGGDIISLLFKAHHEYNQNHVNNDGGHLPQTSSTSSNQHTMQPHQQKPTLTQAGGAAVARQPPPNRPNLLHQPNPPAQIAQHQPPPPLPPPLLLGDPPPSLPTESASAGPKSISLSSLFANAKSQQQREMKLPTIPASVSTRSPFTSGQSATLSAPPPVFTAPITAPIVAPLTEYPSSKPAFVPLDDDVEPNALRLFVQKMKIHDDGKIKEKEAENSMPLPPTNHGRPGMASRRRKDDPASKHKIHRNSVPSHSPPSIDNLPQIPPHFTNSNSSGMAPSSDSPSPSSPLPNKPLVAGFPLLTPDAFEDASSLSGNVALNKTVKGWNAASSLATATSASLKDARSAGASQCGGGVASKMAASLVRNSLILTSDDDDGGGGDDDEEAGLERNSSDDVFDNDDFNEDSDDAIVGYAGGRRGGPGSGGRIDDDQVAGLTKEQLRSTLVHLLQSDTDFLETIHAGYIACLKAPPKKRHGRGKK